MADARDVQRAGFERLTRRRVKKLDAGKRSPGLLAIRSGLLIDATGDEHLAGRQAGCRVSQAANPEGAPPRVASLIGRCVAGQPGAGELLKKRGGR